MSDTGTKPGSLSPTEVAQIEIELGQTRDAEFDALDQEWKRERDKIAASPASTPRLDMVGQSPSSLAEEYDQRRTVHRFKESMVENRWSSARDSVRADGTTLSDAFRDTSANIPAVKHDFAASSANENEQQETERTVHVERTLTREVNTRTAPRDTSQARHR
tara:strand:+ start:14442 stop:14927 length:486 start_codon:yes stop_codon:yes gene_type:complete